MFFKIMATPKNICTQQEWKYSKKMYNTFKKWKHLTAHWLKKLFYFIFPQIQFKYWLLLNESISFY